MLGSKPQRKGSGQEKISWSSIQKRREEDCDVMMCDGVVWQVSFAYKDIYLGLRTPLLFLARDDTAAKKIFFTDD